MAFFACGQARADTVLTFYATGALSDGGTLGGTVTIDTTTGAVQSAALTALVPVTYTFSTNVGVLDNYQNSGISVIVADAPTSSFYPIILVGQTGHNLIGLAGGQIYPGSHIVFNDGTPQIFVTSGSLSQVPEPSSFALAGLALVSSVLRLRRRPGRTGSKAPTAA